MTAYLEAENAYADAVMKPTEAFQEALYAEMLARIKEDDQSVPYRRGGWLLLLADGDGQAVPDPLPQAGSLRRRKRSTLDLNALAEGHPFLALGAYAVSDDGRWLAYSVDYTGFREYTLFVKDLRHRRAAGRSGSRRSSSVAWAADSATIFYVARGRGQATVPACCATGWARRSPTIRCSTRRRTSCSASACGARGAGALLFAAAAASPTTEYALPAGRASPAARGG